MAREELCAKVILARGGESKVTVESRDVGEYVVRGPVAGEELQRLAREDPGQLQQLLERAAAELDKICHLGMRERVSSHRKAKTKGHG